MKGWRVLSNGESVARIPEIHHNHITLAAQEHYARRNVAWIGRRLLRMALRIEWSDDLDWRLPSLADLVEARRGSR